MSENPFVVPTVESGSTSSAPKDPSDKNLGILCHVLAFSTFVVPFGNILGPLVLWLIKRAESPYLDAVGKEVINFNISWLIYGALAALSIFVLIGFLLAPLVLLVWIILVVIGSISASEGKIYRYPLTIRLIT